MSELDGLALLLLQAVEQPTGRVQQIDWSELQLVEPAIAAGTFKTVHRARWRSADVAVLRLRRGDISTEAAVPPGHCCGRHIHSLYSHGMYSYGLDRYGPYNMAYIVMAYVVMTCIVMAYIVMAYIVMACIVYGLHSLWPMYLEAVVPRGTLVIPRAGFAVPHVIASKNRCSLIIGLRTARAASASDTAAGDVERLGMRPGPRPKVD